MTYTPEQIETAFRCACKDKDYRGTHTTHKRLSLEAKQFTAEIYQRLTGVNVFAGHFVCESCGGKGCADCDGQGVMEEGQE